MAEVVIRRAEARAQGLARYFTGKACKRRHVAERRTGDGGCIHCRDEWHAANPDRMRAHRAKWEAANPDKCRQSSRRWREANPEKQAAASKRWAKENPDRVLARGRKWGRANPEVVAAKTNRRRARKIAAGGAHSAADLRAILRAQRFRCGYCRTDIRKTKRHADHIIPLSSGGSNSRVNIQWLCAPCNLAKGAKDPVLFAREQGRLL
jgi:5-methylcytosine-specific restriction endonuclease McrA